jgi:hypothetical protein
MHHFRGKLLEGNQSRLDPANVYIDFPHPATGGPVQDWSGYLVVASESDVQPGVTYTLRLEDGRSGGLKIDRTAPDDDSGKFRAFFAGDGPLQ